MRRIINDFRNVLFSSSCLIFILHRCCCDKIICYSCVVCFFFFFKQKTEYELLISDWSSDVCSSDLEPHPRGHDGLAALLDAMELPELGDLWIAAYVRWEIGVLADLGYGLDLDSCAVTGRNDDLAYVSPRSGRAVSLSAGQSEETRVGTGCVR